MIATLWILWILGVPQVTGTVVLGAIVVQLLITLMSVAITNKGNES